MVLHDSWTHDGRKHLSTCKMKARRKHMHGVTLGKRGQNVPIYDAATVLRRRAHTALSQAKSAQERARKLFEKADCIEKAEHVERMSAEACTHEEDPLRFLTFDS